AILTSAALGSPFGACLPLRSAEYLAETFPHSTRAGGDVDVAVAGRKNACRNASRVIVAGLAGHFAGHEPTRSLEIQHKDLRLEQARRHPATDATSGALDQRHRDAQRQH